MFYLEAHDSKAAAINVKAYFLPVCFRRMGVLFCRVVFCRVVVWIILH